MFNGINKQFTYNGYVFTHGYKGLVLVCSRFEKIPNNTIANTASSGDDIKICLGTYPTSRFGFATIDNNPLITTDGPKGAITEANSPISMADHPKITTPTYMNAKNSDI